MLNGLANRKDPDQIYVLSMPFWQATSVRNLRTFTVHTSEENGVSC